MEVFMKKTICVFLVVCFFIAATSKPARADGFSVGAALLGGFLIGTIWAPRVVTGPPMIHGPAVQYHYPQPQYRGGYYAAPPPPYYAPPPARYVPEPTTVCAQDIYGNINCRTIQY